MTPGVPNREGGLRSLPAADGLGQRDRGGGASTQGPRAPGQLQLSLTEMSSFRIPETFDISKHIPVTLFN